MAQNKECCWSDFVGPDGYKGDNATGPAQPGDQGPDGEPGTDTRVQQRGSSAMYTGTNYTFPLDTMALTRIIPNLPNVVISSDIQIPYNTFTGEFTNVTAGELQVLVEFSAVLSLSSQLPPLGTVAMNYVIGSDYRATYGFGSGVVTQDDYPLANRIQGSYIAPMPAGGTIIPQFSVTNITGDPTLTTLIINFASISVTTIDI